MKTGSVARITKSQKKLRFPRVKPEKSSNVFKRNDVSSKTVEM